MSKNSNENKNCYDFLLDECIKKNIKKDCEIDNINLLEFVNNTKNKISGSDNVELKPYDSFQKYNSTNKSQTENMKSMNIYLSNSYNLNPQDRKKSLKFNSSSIPKTTSTKLDPISCFNEIRDDCNTKNEDNESCNTYIRNHFKKYYTYDENQNLYNDEILQQEKYSNMQAFINKINESINESITNILKNITIKNEVKKQFLINKKNIQNIFYKDSSSKHIIYYQITKIESDEKNNYYSIDYNNKTNVKTFINDLEITVNKSSKIDINDYILGKFNDNKWYKGKIIKTDDKVSIRFDDGEIYEINNNNIKLIKKTLFSKIDNIIKTQILNLIKLLLKYLNTILINTRNESFTTLEQITDIDKQEYINHYTDFNQYDIAYYNTFIKGLTTILHSFEEQELDNTIKEYIGNFKFIYTYLENLKLIGRYEATKKYNDVFINVLSKFTNIPKKDSKTNTKRGESEFLELLKYAMSKQTKQNITFSNGKGGKSRKNNKRKTQKKRIKKNQYYKIAKRIS